jgi:polyene macrolide polyketide synthase
VVFSSLAGILGGPGQGNYAAGNVFLDTLVQRRRRLGLPGVSLAWGPWAPEVGLVGSLSETDRRRIARSGLPVLSVRQGLELFDRALRTDRAVVGLARLDTAALRARRDLPPLWRVLAGVTTRRSVEDSRQGTEGLARQLAGMPAAERERFLVDLVRGHVAAVLGHASGEQIGGDQPFNELGFDSLTAIELRNRLQAATGVGLPATLVFDHPDVLSLANGLGASLPDSSGSPIRGADPQREPHRDPYAELYWRALRSGRQVDVAYELAMNGARLRPKSEDSAQMGRRLSPVRISSGDSGPHLICVCPPIVLAGPQLYMRFAAEFGGRRRASALMPPGFHDEDDLPASAEVMVYAMADAVERYAGDSVFSLAGLSAGGVLAYEIAKELEARGTAPAGVVLLDTYRFDDEVLQRWKHKFSESTFERLPLVGGSDFGRITATAWICSELFFGWRPEGLWTPSLHVRASAPMVEEEEGVGWRSSLASMTSVVDVPGNHYTMLDDQYVGSTVKVVHNWLIDVEERGTQ